MTQPPSGEWVYFNTEVTNSSGRVSFVIPEDKRLGIGVYPVKMVVRYNSSQRKKNNFTWSLLFSVFLLCFHSPEATTHLQTATWQLFQEAQSLWSSASTGRLLPACRSWAVIPKCGQELWMLSGNSLLLGFSRFLGFEARVSSRLKHIHIQHSFFLILISCSSLIAGTGRI